MIQRYDDMTIRCYYDTMMQCNATIQRCNDTTMQQYNERNLDGLGSSVGRSHGHWVCSSALVNASLLCNYAFKQVRRKGWTARWLSQRKWAIIFGQTDTTCNSWSAIMWVKLDHHALQHGLTLRFFFKFVSWANCSNTYRPTESPRKQKM